MAYNKICAYLFTLSVLYIFPYVYGIDKFIPLIVTTWDYENATQVAWDTIYNSKGSAIDAIEKGCSYCEAHQCRGTVGFGGSPDENGETTLDAMLMDGVTMDVGGVGSLRNVKSAISVARHVLENTEHSFIVGDLATEFAIKLGFANESLQTKTSRDLWENWKNNKCQPNFWKNVVPNPKTSCGPYQPKKTMFDKQPPQSTYSNEYNHDTIGMIAVDTRGHIAAGTSTNGARNKIPGRVGDSPIAGAGAYADQEVGAAAATGDGDIMMRFLPSFLAVEMMRQGETPKDAATAAIRRIIKFYPNFSGAVIALDKKGQFGAACHNLKTFPFYAVNLQLGKPTLYHMPCV